MKLTKGNVLLVTVLFFITISAAVVVSLSSSQVKQIKSTTSNLKSIKSHALAESGAEDTIYRIINNKQIGSSNSLTIDGQTVTTSIGSGSGAITLNSTSDYNQHIKSLNIEIDPAIGISLSRAIEAGPGGVYFYLSGSTATYVQGDIYSNGWIQAITNVGYLPLSNAKSFNQNPETMISTFDNSSGAILSPLQITLTQSSRDIAFSFTPDFDGSIGRMEFYMKGLGASMTVQVQTNNPQTNLPSGTVLSQAWIDTNSHPTQSWKNPNWGWVNPNAQFFGQQTPTIYSGTKYWIVVKSGSGAAGSDFHTIFATIPYSGTESVFTGNTDTNSWNVVSGVRPIFKIYSGGVKGVFGPLKNATFAWNGDVYADTIYNSNLYYGHQKYCQEAKTGNGTYTVSPCAEGFSQGPQPFTITNSMINQIKASSGSDYTIDYDLTIAQGTSMSLGPVKINGRLNINGTLIVTGGIYATGNITMGPNGKIELSPDFGDKDGIIITDGRFSGEYTTNIIKGTASYGSYTMVISTSKCPSSCDVAGKRAITWSGTNGNPWHKWLPNPGLWAPGPMFFAPNGWAQMNKTAYLNFVAGDRVELLESVELNGNESTMTSLNFVAAKALKSWKETD